MISQAANDRFEMLYQRLIVTGVQAKIGTTLSNTTPFTDEDLSFLLSVASRLALDNEDTTATGSDKRMKAYEIATRTMDFVPQQHVLVDAAGLILARLGNFPARALLDKRQPRKEFSLPPYLELEALAREIENTIHIREDVAVPVTDFQVKLLDALQRSPAVSVSAPTSAGKSFALSLDIVRRLEKGKSLIVVYLVPTRALIRQVMYDTIGQLNDHRLVDVPVLCVPEPLTLQDAPKGVVYVLTQERLLSLLYSVGPIPQQHIDVLIVDEAQEISDGGRGLVLEIVIEQTLKRNPHAAVFFSSPLRSNPGYLLNHFGRSTGEFFVERVAPVAQTLILVTTVKGKPTQANVNVLIGNENIKVAQIDLPFKFRNPYLHKIAITFTRADECSIIYANDPGTAESIAEDIASELPVLDELDEEIIDLIAFVKAHIHPKYRLIECLERGVAFHYGQMPQIIRARVEDLLKKRALRFVCCTSTLLQGVNLPAKNIFIENPQKGRGRPMRSGDFWNLAGRAGRLAKEFHGNVWCIYGKHWDNDPFDGEKLEEMKSAFTNTLLAEPERVLEVIKNSNLPSEAEDTQLYEQVFGRIFNDYMLEGRSISDISAVPESKRPFIVSIEKECATIASNMKLPRQVFARNATISPL